MLAYHGSVIKEIAVMVDRLISGIGLNHDSSLSYRFPQCW